MDYQKNKFRPKFKKTERPSGFHGCYVEVREGEDAVRAYRKIKRWIKEDKFVETVKEKGTYRKPSEIKREKNINFDHRSFLFLSNFPSSKRQYVTTYLTAI